MSIVAIGLLLPALAGVVSANPWLAELEAGVAWLGYNDVQVPGDSGTRLSATDDLKTEAPTVWRLRLGMEVAPRHEVFVTLAPFSLTGHGTAASEITFEDEVFPAGEYLRLYYRFSTYRATYRYTGWQLGEGWDFALGFTALIRDAEIELESDGRHAQTTNIGFVPLVHLRLEAALPAGFAAGLEGDALIGPQGRAEDVLLFVSWEPAAQPGLRFFAGYRFIEGGADVPDVYNFALIHFVVVGFSWNAP